MTRRLLVVSLLLYFISYSRSQTSGSGAGLCGTQHIRLVGGSNDNEGRVEVCLDEEWGTVCDDFWDSNDAAVVCRELGLGYTAAISYKFAHFGPGTGPILLDDVQCTGDEESIFDCTYNRDHDCAHFEDAGVSCINATCTEGDIRLANGYSEYEGRVEICLNGLWGTVCDDFWSNNDAVVVCRQLGLPFDEAVAIGSAYFGLGSGLVNIGFVFCDGTESSLLDCFYFSQISCPHSKDASVVCVDTQSNCTDGEVRLVGGTNETEGRVEVCEGNEWGTVCDDQWDNDDATVICRQLGYNTDVAIAVSSAGYGQGIGQILFDEVKCTGTEDDIYECDYTPFHDCSHLEDAGVQCGYDSSECSHGEVKLVGGDSDTEGRVEVCVGGYWGTVCDDGWTYQDAQVVCDQLGYPSGGAIAWSSAHFGVGSGRINMDDVECEGDEGLLLNCSYNPQHNCIHAEDAGVQCLEAECDEGSVRLVGGLNETEGRVEVCLGGQWGTVCDDLWGVNDARVVCRQLGYPWEGAEAYSFAEFGQGVGLIVLDNVDCDGDEDSILDCPYDDDTSDCTHFEDAGVKCLESKNECENYDIRLVGGDSEDEGRVEVCLLGAWGTVCDDFWDANDATVVCRELGLGYTGVIAHRQAHFGPGTGPILLDNVQCTGDEESIFNCTYNPDHNCGHFEDAGVSCINATCTEGDVRLVNGYSDYEGRVEICLNGVWGTVCDDDWDNDNAMVVCNQLGLPFEDAIGLGSAYFGLGIDPINLDNVNCDGTELFLTDCSYTIVHNCFHSEDASVICVDTQSNCTDGDVRLVGGTNETEGRVEVCEGNEWGTVCDDQWDNDDATVICRQLGYSDEGAVAVTNAGFGRGVGDILFDDVKCTGTEEDIFACDYTPLHNCGHFEDAGVKCQPAGPEVSPTIIPIPSTISSILMIPTATPDEGGSGCDGGIDCYSSSIQMVSPPSTITYESSAMFVLPSVSTTPTTGSCIDQGFTDGCCVSDCLGSDGLCYCDIDCYHFGDCCPDIQEAGCYNGGSATSSPPPDVLPSSSMMVLPSPTSSPSLGLCAQAGFSDGCCTDDPYCEGANGAKCFCDSICYSHGDCCDDILDIGCMAPSVSPDLHQGSCVDQGFTDGCCVSDDSDHECVGSSNICYCDAKCYQYDDCCRDIEQAGCFEFDVSTTLNPSLLLSSRMAIPTEMIESSTMFYESSSIEMFETVTSSLEFLESTPVFSSMMIMSSQFRTSSQMISSSAVLTSTTSMIPSMVYSSQIMSSVTAQPSSSFLSDTMTTSVSMSESMMIPSTFSVSSSSSGLASSSSSSSDSTATQSTTTTSQQAMSTSSSSLTTLVTSTTRLSPSTTMTLSSSTTSTISTTTQLLTTSTSVPRSSMTTSYSTSSAVAASSSPSTVSTPHEVSTTTSVAASSAGSSSSSTLIAVTSGAATTSSNPIITSPSTSESPPSRTSSISTRVVSSSVGSCTNTPQASPSADDTVMVTINGFTANTFNSSIQMKFEDITTIAIKSYCRSRTSECNLGSSTSDDICLILYPVQRQTRADNSVQLQLQAATDNGQSMLPADSIIAAVNNANNNGNYSRAGFTSITFSKLSTVGDNDRSTGLSTGTEAGIAIGVVVVLLIVIVAIAVITILVIKKRRNSQRYVIGGRMFEDTTLLTLPKKDETYTDITKLVINVHDDEEFEEIKKEDLSVL